MGVRFYDKENMSNGDDYSSTNTTTTTRRSCNCNTCNPQQQTATFSTTTATTQTSSNNLNFQKSGILKEIIGNCKEMRIEENIHNLRIVGNNNRIRITINVGDITIIGNNTRLKIKTNHGLIKYTGNDGRICLGQDSTEQFVDYSGCNGVLKVQNSKKSNKHDNSNNEGDEFKNKTPMGNTYLNGNFNKKSNIKSASYSGSPSESEMHKCHMDYNNIFNRKISMPNIKLENRNQQKQKQQQQQQPKSIVHNFGNIVIANSSNVCITPYTYTY
ncbi:poor Imd response upon knock-in [Cochliomyia hominivorax]